MHIVKRFLPDEGKSRYCFEPAVGGRMKQFSGSDCDDDSGRGLAHQH